MILNLLNSDEERNQFKDEYDSLASEIASAVNHKYGTQFTGGYIANYSVAEPIASLLSLN